MSTPIDIDPKDYVEALELLKTLDFLQGVPDDRLKGMLFSLQKQTFTPNKTILFQGEIANRLFIIQKGAVIITTKNKNTKLHLADLGAHMYFGEISLLTPTSATATATAGAEGAQVLILNHDSVEELMNKNIPDIKQRIQQVIDNRIASKKRAKDADNAE